MRTPPRPARRLTIAAVLALAATVVAGCSSGDPGATAEGGGTSQSEDRAVGGDQSGGVGSAPATGDGAAKPGVDPVAVAPAVLDRKLSRRADISVDVEDVDVAASRVRSIAVAADGMVLAESIQSEPELREHGGFSTVTISVPTAALDATLDQLAKLGTVHARHTSTDDVTAQYVDTESRVKTMQASVERVRALMTRATRLADIVTLEAELSRRQADLEATQTQLAALADAVALAPVEVRLSTDATVLETADDDTGFLAGLTAGWSAFTASVTTILTVLGALLPFAVVLTLVAVPLVVWLRRRGSGVAAPAPPTA
jgi:Domain of unknown function (DUF4349)